MMKKLISTTLLALFLGSCTAVSNWQPPTEPEEMQRLRELAVRHDCDIDAEFCSDAIPPEEWIYLGKYEISENQIDHWYVSDVRSMKDGVYFNSLHIYLDPNQSQSVYYETWYEPIGNQYIECFTDDFIIRVWDDDAKDWNIFNFGYYQENGEFKSAYFDRFEEYLQSSYANSMQGFSLEDHQRIYEFTQKEYNQLKYICRMSDNLMFN